MAWPFFKSEKRTEKSVKRAGKRAFRAPRDKNSGWRPIGGTQERAPSALSVIRAHARDLSHNNPYGSRAVNALTSHAIGTGIRASITGDDDFEKAFISWAESVDVDYEGRLNFYGLQSLASRSMFEAGDSFIIMREVRRNDDLTLKLQIIDADQLDTGASPIKKGNSVHQGVEIYPSGIIAGYHIRLDASKNNSIFVGRRNVIHLIELLYPGQLRGVPRGAQALATANTVGEFFSTALARAKSEACFTAFVTTPHADSAGGLIGEIDDDDGFLIPENLEPGMIIPLNPGEDVKVAQPPSSGGMREYIKVGLQAVAAAYGVTYDQISADLEGSNFSSHKAGKLEFNRSIDNLRAHTLLPAFRRIVERYKKVFEANEGRVSNATYSLVSPKREGIEPLKDAQATNLKLQNGTLSWSDAVREEGKDPDKQIAEIAGVLKKFEASGLQFSFELGPVKIISYGNDENEGKELKDETDGEVEVA